ncbi:small ribosomal subunit biogenesis GTPase RsgA [Testudinibacter sp. TR-2022]|uniref:small ribosomal subunit biogenesis GTPase RsgA n=1 Tax=Testudinibacter sp. TR-2022 TaxID=2585029 RepID=UPI001117F976|nr:small ribosomal subunit biogenesis GTPase RsgA [Testudinibacter sp. TR-2022]TNH01272.1 small ribosomal subunit biogenesis GTPase RsgA [Pasteurellaceae bacterium Phil31]TNH09072.1 small ribosomal subunit biogenesis GTPase RsgA [Testudinibacter sp. TR-2022]TNH12909.1 small ribosomal subunit biogenesis GTPase RsgA [Testudinibacter sp. TR-2022]TNH13125.1 small ribosomal subunit biogenesis GTPase RsgA [Testudinibacter sp. TR-2022]TNH18192.1 small ribosomal subunit biogenesis GTPase RsgA [Testudi
MSKQKLTKNQKRRIQSNKQKTLNDYQQRKKEKRDSVEWQDEMLGEIQQGRVISRYALHADIEGHNHEVFRCNLRRTVSNLVVGDYVLWRAGHQQLQGISGVVEAVQPRKNVLSRPDYYDGIKLIAANIDKIFIVSAMLPHFSSNIIDRYLVVCESLGIEPILVLNKVDLCEKNERQEVEQLFDIYRNIGYKVLMLSTQSGENMAQFTELVSQGCTIFVGQSGVGKSSLLNYLEPQLGLQIGAVSENSGLGQHTTTVSRLIRLKCGGEVIDSPGIREFGVWHLDSNTITNGYREFQPYLGGCKFRDCKHLDDPGCVLQQAVEQGKIHPLRFENYHRLIVALDENKAGRHFVTN